jgi:hypothetical protein
MYLICFNIQIIFCSYIHEALELQKYVHVNEAVIYLNILTVVRGMPICMYELVISQILTSKQGNLL